MKDRTLENKTRVYVDGIRVRVGNPRHPYHELYMEEGIDAVYDMMFKAPTEETPVKKQRPDWEAMLICVMGLTVFGILAAGAAMSAGSGL